MNNVEYASSSTDPDSTSNREISAGTVPNRGGGVGGTVFGSGSLFAKTRVCHVLARDTARVEFNDIGSGRRETVPEYPVSVERVGGIVYDLPASKSVIKPLRAHEKFEGGE